MSNHDNDFFKNFKKAALISSISAEMQKIDCRKIMAEMSEGTQMSRQYLEHHPSIETGVTDKDILLLQIDPWAASFIAQHQKDGFKVKKANKDVINGIVTQGVHLSTTK